MSVVRRHWLALLVAVLALAHWGLFTVMEWGYFQDQARNLNEVLRAAGSRPSPVPGFWSGEHLHDWSYNYAANVLSELTFGVVLVMILSAKGEPT